MVGMMKKHTSHWWWLDSHHNSKKSPWLESTLSELDEKTEAMLRLIDEDADSFAQRAEMYYKKRPELISMVEDFYRAHRSLAERYDQIKSETATRLLASLGSPFTSPRSSISSISPIKHCQEKQIGHSVDRNYVSFSENSDHEDSADSEVEDPEEEVARDRDLFAWVSDEEVRKFKEEIDRLREERQLDLQKLEEIQSAFGTDEVRMLKEQIDKLREEIERQRFQMMEKDEEMEQVMRQLSLAKEAVVSCQVRNDEMMKLKEEIQRMKDEIQRQNEQIMQKDEEKRDLMMQLSLLHTEKRLCCVLEDEVGKVKEEMESLQDEVSRQHDLIKQTSEEKEELIRQLGVAREVNSRVISNEFQKLKQEITRLEEQDMTQKDQIKQAIEDKEEIIGQLGVAREANSRAINSEFQMLKGEINRLEEQNMTHKYQLLQKDEEKREVIRQLGMTVDVLKEENLMLRKYVSREAKKQNSSEFNSFLRKLFNGRARPQSSAAAPWFY